MNKTLTASPNKTLTASQIKRLPAPTVKKLLREAGYTFTAVAQLPPPRHYSLITSVVKKRAQSNPVWERIEWCLAHPKVTNDRAALPR